MSPIDNLMRIAKKLPEEDVRYLERMAMRAELNIKISETIIAKSERKRSSHLAHAATP